MLPEPPVNVRVLLADGSEVAVDTVYVGVENKTHTWQVIDGPPLEQVKGLTIDKLPPHTQVSMKNGYAGR